MTTAPNVPVSGAALDEDRLALLALALAPGLGPRRILDAMRQLEAPSQIFGMPLTAIEALKFPAISAQYVFDGKARAGAEQEWNRAREQGVELVTLACPQYPERLKEIYDPPPVLWVRGNAGLLARPSIAVVGTRHPTPYGTGIAEMLARDLSARGMLIVSGMARGIDTAAHKGTLAAGKPTVAVWGTGADVIYPKENKRLAEDILAMGGAIVSELPLGTFPAPQNFPRRNRIISGLSIGVLVVEASEHSGTRVTARCAADQGRDVFAVPGNVTSKNSWTPNTLIKQGAQLTATWEDVWEVLSSQVRLELESGWAVESGSESKAAAGASLLPDPAIGANEAIVLEVLRQDAALQIDEILELCETQLTSSEVFTALFELELAGRIRSMPGKNYVRSF
ncbi:DNA-processing protein DprA [Acidicapsa acidisoli]|uniref:DNA-processing protein DprA n=1 Tax=Acidicapsa acidisoli TaxID=1615681 RepID=UPI0021E051C6|nr:DNA-processing protein DprA [Acidicapsa acidisoli]